MESSFLHTAGIIGAIVVALCLIAFAASLVGERLHRMSRSVVGPFLADEQHVPFAVPMNAEPDLVHEASGEAWCVGCVQPTSVVGVLSTVRMRGANVPADLCASCEALYGHHVVERAPLLLVRGDLSDFEIPARVLPFPDTALKVKQGLVS